MGPWLSIAAASQMRVWQSSLAHMHLVLVDPEIPADTGVGIEYQIPQTAKRIDVLLSGRDDTSADRVVIVELKQWQDAESTPMDGVVRTVMGGALVATPLHGEESVSGSRMKSPWPRAASDSVRLASRTRSAASRRLSRASPRVAA